MDHVGGGNRDPGRAEEQLTVLLAQRGNRDAFRRLVDRYDRRLLYFVRRILGESDGSFDVLQSIWLTVHRRLKGLRAPDAFRVWLYRIAHDQAVTELRRRARRPFLFEDVDAPEICEEATSEEVAFEDAELIHAAIQKLSIDHRRVLTLHFLEEMPIEEIAEVIGCPLGTVKSRIHYAKLALRRRIEELIDGRP
jgi:RNA polymerase sigma-70 factor (ECF subfamily)